MKQASLSLFFALLVFVGLMKWTEPNTINPSTAHLPKHNSWRVTTIPKGIVVAKYFMGFKIVIQTDSDIVMQPVSAAAYDLFEVNDTLK